MKNLVGELLVYKQYIGAPWFAIVTKRAPAPRYSVFWINGLWEGETTSEFYEFIEATMVRL